MTNPSHYSNIDREPREGDRARNIIEPGRFGEEYIVDGTALARVGNGWPSQHELVQPWWDATAKPGAKWKDRTNSVWIKRYNGLWSAKIPEGIYSALELEDSCGPGELVAPAPKPAPIPEPTAPGALVRGTIDGKTVRALRADTDGLDWLVYEPGHEWFDWIDLLDLLDEAPTIIDTDQPTGLTEEQREAIRVAAMGFDDVGMTPFSECLRAAFPEVFAEPEPACPLCSGNPFTHTCGSLPDFRSAPAWMDRHGQIHTDIDLGPDMEPWLMHQRLAPWTPLMTAKDWAKQRDDLATAAAAELSERTLMTSSESMAVLIAAPDPTGGDPVVVARLSEASSASLFFRCKDGSWSQRRGREHSRIDTGKLKDVRRLQPATIADLMGNIENTTKEN